MQGSLSGIITSENFPKKYPQNTDCFYHIVVPQIFNVKISFDKFDLEYDKKCRNDFLAITDRKEKPWNCSFCQRLCGHESADILVVKSDGTKEFMEKTNNEIIIGKSNCHQNFTR